MLKPIRHLIGAGILAALTAGDAALASQRLREHVRNGLSGLVAALKDKAAKPDSA